MWPLPGLEGAWMWPTGLMVFPVAAALVLARRPGNTVGRVLGLVALSSGVVFTLYWFAATFPALPVSRPAEAISGAAVLIQFGGLLALLHLFPTGRAVNRVHGKVVAALAWWAGAMAALALATDPLANTGRPNALAVLGLWPGAALQAGLVGLPVFALAGIVALVGRWRRAGTVERAQLKWFFAGAALLVMLLVVIVFVPETVTFGGLDGVIAVAGFWGLPAAVVIAVTRYRLYEIDRIVSRTVSYALLTGLLVTVYLAAVFALQQLLRPVTGESQLAVAGATLAVAALFQPARRRIQAAVNRRFNRARYDAQRTVEAYRARLRDKLDIDELTTELASTAEGAVAPTTVQVWLRGRQPRKR